MTAAVAAACTALGLVVGWLLDPVITRVPRKVSVLGPPSADEPPSPTTRRALVVLLCGALFGATGARFDDSWALPAYLVLAAALVALSAIDLEHYLLPNRIVYPLTVAMIALLGVASIGDDDIDAFGRGLLAGAIAFAVFFVLHVISPRSMGFGDVRLSFTLGLALGWLGWGELFLGIFLAFVYGAVVGIALMLFFRRDRKQAVPFGPFLAAGTLTAILVGQAIITWYTNGG
ncbi:MAG: prepilin peptidase [Acidimicrobiia bacterium]